MPRKSTKSVTADVKQNIVENDLSDDSMQDNHLIDDVETAPVTTRSAPKARKTVVDKIDWIIQLIEQGASVSVVTKNLQSVRKTLDGAQIKSTKKTRKPNSYNIFMSEEMEKLKESTMPATEKFKHCINLWNERKLVASKNIAPDPVPASVPIECN